MKRLYAIALLTLSVPGCTSITVHRIDSSQSEELGVRYSLPKPFLLVTPQEDGSVTAKVLYLPDPDHTYAISAGTVAGTYSLRTSLSPEGFLEKVRFSADDAAVAAQLAESAGNAAASRIDQQQKAASDAAAARTARQKQSLDTLVGGVDEWRKANAELNTANATVENARSGVKAAEAALATAQVSGDVSAIAQAQANLVTAQNALRTAEAGLKNAEEAKALVSSLLRIGGATAGLPGASQATATKKANGPALFAIKDRRVEDGRYYPRLVAVKYPVTDPVTGSTQLSFDAIDNRPSKPAETAEPLGPPILRTATARKGEEIKIDLSKMGAKTIVNVECRVESTEVDGKELKVELKGEISTDQILTLTLPTNAEPGTYDCYIDVGTGERKTEKQLTVKE